MYIDSFGVYGGMGIKTMKAFSRQKGTLIHLSILFFRINIRNIFIANYI